MLTFPALAAQRHDAEEGNVVKPCDRMRARGTLGARVRDRLFAWHPVDAHIEKAADAASEEEPEPPPDDRWDRGS